MHRIGRTARAGASGHAITFAMPDEFREIRAIERLIRKNLPVSKLPELPAMQPLTTQSFGFIPRRIPARGPSSGGFRRRRGFSRPKFR